MPYAHQPVANRPIERRSAEPSLGEGEVQPLGKHAALGLETLDGWTRPAHDRAQAGYRREAIIGTDDRVRVRETSSFPWRAICHLQIYTADGEDYGGTGWLIGPRTVITAGHCVFLHTLGAWVERIVVSPARNGRDRPFSSSVSREFQSIRGWIINGQPEHDYGAIILPADQAVPEAGHFGYSVSDTASLRRAYLNVSGYPADREEATQWWSARSSRRVNETTIWYDADTAQGQSGAPVWRLDPRTGKRVVVGIHTNGADSGNSATRITADVFANLERWKTL